MPDCASCATGRGNLPGVTFPAIVNHPKQIIASALAAVVLFAALLIPERGWEPPADAATDVPASNVASADLAPAGAGPFRWNDDALWRRLERRFEQARALGCDEAAAEIGTGLRRVDRLLNELGEASVPTDERWSEIESTMFGVAATVAACPEGAPAYIEVYSDIRSRLKEHSVAWEPNAREVKERMYRMLYGLRVAVEQILLQMDGSDASDLVLVRGDDEPSTSRSVTIRGVDVHSGDILVSRGGFPTSALIARGSDFPGNFSHVSLVQVDKNDQLYIIEAHIDRGLTVASYGRYFADSKLRVMLLRPRHDLPQIEDDPELPHVAASRALARAHRNQVPYDFEMDYTDPERLFCSEVASSAYAELGVDLWAGISTISAPGLKRWLAHFGVRNFETQEPSDLEYDPQLVVVAEWRDPDALFGDHVDNAVVDAMLEGAENGDDLEYPALMLPVARVAKAYSLVLDAFGRIGPIPQGMSATAALRNRAYHARHNRLAAAVHERALAFEDSTGYRPPYWELVEMARDAVRSAG